MSTVDDLLEHHGVKGMHWGVRKAGEPSSSDHSRAKAAVEKAKSHGGTHTLSNEELQHVITRMNLEKQYSSIVPKSTSEKAAGFVKDILANTGKQQATQAANKGVAKIIAKHLAKTAAVAVVA